MTKSHLRIYPSISLAFVGQRALPRAFLPDSFTILFLAPIVLVRVTLGRGSVAFASIMLVVDI